MNKCINCEEGVWPCVYEFPELVELYVVLGTTKFTQFFLTHESAIDFIDKLPDDAMFDVLEHNMFTGQSLIL